MEDREEMDRHPAPAANGPEWSILSTGPAAASAPKRWYKEQSLQ